MNPKAIRLIMLIFMSLIGYFLWVAPFRPELLIGLTVTVALLTLLWLCSLIIKDSSIIDIYWGFGFVIVVWLYLWLLGSEFQTPRNFIFASLVSIWGLRLSFYIGKRNLGKGEDYRYQEMRAESGKHYWWVSYLRVFLLQGIVLWMVSSLFVPVLKGTGDFLSIFTVIGITLWSVGFFFEAAGDWQLTQFKKNPANKGKVMDKGLWRYTRHPNYFGDALLWWGYFAFALDYHNGFFYMFAPIFMTFLLRWVSGADLLEVKLQASKPGYKEYMEKTSAFFPMPPKK